MSNKSLIFDPDTYVGFFDADGTFTLRILLRKKDKIGVSALCSIKQNNRGLDMLTAIKANIGGNLQQNCSQTKQESRLDIFLTTEAGTKWLSILEKCKPILPTKRRDYLISLKIVEYAADYVLSEVKQLSLNPGETAEKISALAVIELVYSMSNDLLPSGRGSLKKKPKQEYIDHINCTENETKQGQAVYKEINEKIEKEVATLTTELKTGKFCPSDHYITGYYLGDGCLFVGVGFRDQCTSIDVNVSFTMTDSLANIAFLESLVYRFGCGTVAENGPNVAYFRIRNWDQCNNVVVPILQSVACLPSSKEKQLDSFVKASKLVEAKQHLTETGLIELIDIIWDMSMEGTQRSKTKAEILMEAQQYLAYKNKKDGN